MPKLTLTEIRDTLNEAIANAQTDMRSDYLTEHEKCLLSDDMTNLITASSLVSGLMKNGSAQLFNGCIGK